MTSKHICLTVLAGLAFATAMAVAPLRAENKFSNAGIDSDQLVYTALHKLQAAVAHNDRNAVASLIQYPLNVDTETNGSNKVETVEIKTRRQFLRRYDWIINSQIRKRILSAKPSNLESSWRGVSLEGGDPNLWFEGQPNSNKILIMTIVHVK